MLEKRGSQRSPFLIMPAHFIFPHGPAGRFLKSHYGLLSMQETLASSPRKTQQKQNQKSITGNTDDKDCPTGINLTSGIHQKLLSLYSLVKMPDWVGLHLYQWKYEEYCNVANPFSNYLIYKRPRSENQHLVSAYCMTDIVLDFFTYFFINSLPKLVKE